MRALVTGACGFVGSYLVKHLQECGDQVVGGVFGKAPEECKFEAVKLDVKDSESCARVINSIKPEAIYHLAGMAFVPEAENNFLSALNINVVGTSNIYRVAHLIGLGCSIVYVSSAEVYGRIAATDLPITEQVSLNPNNNYSLSKAMAEMVAQRYGQLGNIKSKIVRPFNHIGPGQSNQFVASSFADQLAQIAHNKRPAVIQVGNLEAKRDFSDVRDIVRAYRLIAERGTGVYNLGSGRSTAIQEILDSLIGISKLKVDVQQVASRMRASEVPEIYGSYQKAKCDLDWQPRISLNETLEGIYKYWFDFHSRG